MSTRLHKRNILLNRKSEVISLCKDINRFEGKVYLSRGKVYDKISMSSESTILFSDRPLDFDFRNKVAIFLIYNESLLESKSIQNNMAKVKRDKGVVCSITDNVSWGWCGTFTDYRFVIPHDTEVYSFLFRLLEYYGRRLHANL